MNLSQTWTLMPGTRDLFQYIKTVFAGVGIPILKIRRSWDRFTFIIETPISVRLYLYIDRISRLSSVQKHSYIKVFIMGIPVLVRPHLYTEAVPVPCWVFAVSLGGGVCLPPLVCHLAALGGGCSACIACNLYICYDGCWCPGTVAAWETASEPGICTCCMVREMKWMQVSFSPEWYGPLRYDKIR